MGKIRLSYNAKQYEGIIEQLWTWLMVRTIDPNSLYFRVFSHFRR
jgi:hypothetical protein